MILFIFEGRKRDVQFFKVLKKLYWSEKTTIISVYECNIDALYHEMKKLGDNADIAAFLMARHINQVDNPFKNVKRSDEFSEIYLIFDYDFHDTSRTPEELNGQLKHLLDFFCEETDKGKLYINYPMLEAIAYTKTLPDKDFINYTVSRKDCRCFKQKTHEFCSYPNFKFLLNEDENILRENWTHIKAQNADKAKSMCFPEKIDQRNILKAQIDKYETREGCQVAILSAFALLLYDWLGQ